MLDGRRRRRENGLGFLGRPSQLSTRGTNSAVVRRSACSISAVARPWRVCARACDDWGESGGSVGGLLKHRNRVRNEEWDASLRRHRRGRRPSVRPSVARWMILRAKMQSHSIRSRSLSFPSSRHPRVYCPDQNVFSSLPLRFPHKNCLSGAELFWREIQLIYWMA